MFENSLVLWHRDGSKLGFRVVPKDYEPKDFSGIYVFLKRTPYKDHILYIGKSKEVGNRLSSHNKWKEVNALGCTHIALSREIALEDLDYWEKGLIERYQPPCNDYLK